MFFCKTNDIIIWYSRRKDVSLQNQIKRWKYLLFRYLPLSLDIRNIDELFAILAK